MRHRIIILALFAILSAGAAAEPTPAIRYLLGHQATMMDLGLLRLQGALERMIRVDGALFTLSSQHPSVVAYYDEESNLIRIEFLDVLASEHSLPFDDWGKLCRERFERVRAMFRGDKPGSSGLAAQFNHIGWADDNRPFALDAELRNITVVRMYAQFSDAKQECSGRLVGTDVAVLGR